MRTVHIVVPADIDDPARPSGGNSYDRRICAGLAAAGWDVREHGVVGAWPDAGPHAAKALAATIAAIPEGSVVLVDGLIACGVPAVLVPEAARLRLLVLVHMPLGDGWTGQDLAAAGRRERDVLSVASGIVTTSAWTRDWLLNRYRLEPERVTVAEPGCDVADVVPGTIGGGNLLCVAAVTAHKGHDVLLEALAGVADSPWHCTCVGTVERDPAFVDRLRRQAALAGLAARITFGGSATDAELDRAYAAADVLVLASHGETYGMVVTEALARGLPVIATAVGGVPDALGSTATGRRPGMLVTPGDPAALTEALHRWLHDARLRERLRQAARERRATLADWSTTTDRVARLLVDAVAR
jgi:glycosyltransferase involved in cell wall biosynthesis